MKKITLLFTFLITILFCVSSEMTAQVTTAPLGTSTSSSSGRGPFQRSSSGSSSVFSRAHLVYTAAEIASLGIVSGDIISQVNWDLGSTNVITAGGDATLQVYMKNSSIAGTAIAQWSDLVLGATQVGTYTFNTTNNFPGAEGFVDFPTSDFIYTGGSLEIAVDWDCSSLVPLDPAAPNQLFSGNGSLNWHWSATTHNSSADGSGSSGPPSQVKDPLTERVNTQFVYTPGDGSTPPVDLCIGTSTSSSSGRGPFQRSSSSSSSVFSRAHLVYTAAELPTLTAGSIISQISWDLGSTNVITATGDATLNVYMKNSSITGTAVEQWSNLINGATLVGTYTFNTANNFPGAEGFMDFALASSFVYTGDAIEIAVDWDCSSLVPLDPAVPNQLFSGNGSLNWHWSATTHNSSADGSGSSGPPSEVKDPLMERVNTCFLASLAAPCGAAAVALSAGGTTTATASCEDGDWSYYEDPANPGAYVFAIEWDVAGTGSNAAAKAAATVSVTLDGAIGAAAAGADGTWTMKRYWDVTGATLVDPVNVKFFYDQAEVDEVVNAQTAFGGVSEGFEWFKTVGAAFDPSLIDALAVNQDAIILTDVSGGAMENGVLFAQFDGIASFSGGTGATGAGSGSILPIELASFTGKTMSKSNLLEWTTASEENTEFHIIERSLNGRDNWTKVGIEDAKGFSNTLVSYSLEDTKPTSKAYYRLRSVDFDGYEGLSHIVYLERKIDRFEIIAAYPVPTKASLSIDFETVKDQEVNIKMTDILGNEISRSVFAASAGINTETLDVSQLSSGVYFVTIHNGMESITKRVIKN